MLKLDARDFIMPYFVIEGVNKREPVVSMPGIARLSIDNLLKDVSRSQGLGLKAVLLFGVCPEVRKDEKAGYGYSAQGIVQKATAEIKQKLKDITVITDVCLCAYIRHGHCGILKKSKLQGKIQNFCIDSEKTLETLAKIALSHAEAGADWVAPSAMAKGQVLAIRKSLDAHGFKKVKILGYSAKFASNFYGPFREAADSAPQFGDRSAYQLDYADKKAPLKEIAQDIKEGADMVMVKPALSYLDVIRDAKARFSYPLAAYNTSGEYTIVKLGARQGLWDEKRMAAEVITSIKRAGADFIITYHANDLARWRIVK